MAFLLSPSVEGQLKSPMQYHARVFPLQKHLNGDFIAVTIKCGSIYFGEASFSECTLGLLSKEATHITYTHFQLTQAESRTLIRAYKKVWDNIKQIYGMTAHCEDKFGFLYIVLKIIHGYQMLIYTIRLS